MNTADHLATIIEELKKTPSRISDEEAEKLVDEIMDAGKNICGWRWTFRFGRKKFRHALNAYGD